MVTTCALVSMLTGKYLAFSVRQYKNRKGRTRHQTLTFGNVWQFLERGADQFAGYPLTAGFRTVKVDYFSLQS